MNASRTNHLSATWTGNVRLFASTCSLSKHYQQGGLWAVAQRLSNNSEPTFTDETFTDEEVLTIYLFGIIKRRKTIKGIYDYTADHLSGWFPELPSYGGYNQRLNRLNAVFAPLVQKALSEIGGEELPVRSSRIVDSMPIIRCQSCWPPGSVPPTGKSQRGLQTKATVPQKTLGFTA